MRVYPQLIRPLLFRLDPERVHHWTLRACRYAQAAPWMTRFWFRHNHVLDDALRIQIANLEFPNPIGLAAGFDKNGIAVPLLRTLGFGSVEIGSISRWPSTGNPKPRLKRLPLDQALIVNYGLPNDGAEIVARRLANLSMSDAIPLGVNIVKTNRGTGCKPVAEEGLFQEYVQSCRLLHTRADFLTLNLSCPNAEGGADFFSVAGNKFRLLSQLREVGIACPVFLKIAPELSPRGLDQMLAEVAPFDFVRGFHFNLPSGKPKHLQLHTSPSDWQKFPGAIAGRPTKSFQNACIANLYRRMPTDRYAIVGSGGVSSAEDAYEKICLGASIVQIYSCLVYRGPGVLGEINRGLLKLLKRDGFSSLQQAIGSRAKAAAGRAV